MKILAIDDQKLVLLPLEKRLKDLGYDVITEVNAHNAIDVYVSYKPDLLIVDINMPIMSGIDVVKHIRFTQKDTTTPIMVLSGNTDDAVITEGFNLGINDYMKKPLSLNEIAARVKRLIGLPKLNNNTLITEDRIIQQSCVGVVIPCYNEVDRLLSNDFLNFIEKNTGYHLCFVNDGSTDKTLDVLHNIQKGKEDFITVYNCKQNGGKAEAVRQGMLHMATREDLDYIGFLDADLSTDLSDFDDLVATIEGAKYKVVSGSRISRMGADITKDSARKIISLTVNFIIKKILQMDFKDTQCGAKVFHKDVINVSFGKPFITKWIFDVEVFKRIAIAYGLPTAKKVLYEQPLKRWIHADGSKLSLADSFKIIGQLFQIAWYYRKNSTDKKKINNQVSLDDTELVTNS